MKEPKTDDTTPLRRGEPAAVEQWFGEHVQAVYSFVYFRSGRNRQLAEDAVQDTFLRALQRISDFDPDRGSMRLWLLLQARNCLQMQQRHARWMISLDDPAVSGEFAGNPSLNQDDAVPPEKILEDLETAELTELVLGLLPGHYRRLLLRRYGQGESLAAMANAEGTTGSSVKSTLFRARQLFKEIWLDLRKEWPVPPPQHQSRRNGDAVPTPSDTR